MTQDRLTSWPKLSLVAQGCQCMCWHPHLENELLKGKNEAHPFSIHMAPVPVICAERSTINIYYGKEHISPKVNDGSRCTFQKQGRAQGYVKEQELNFFPVLEKPGFEIKGIV